MLPEARHHLRGKGLKALTGCLTVTTLMVTGCAPPDQVGPSAQTELDGTYGHADIAIDHAAAPGARVERVAQRNDVVGYSNERFALAAETHDFVQGSLEREQLEPQPEDVEPPTEVPPVQETPPRPDAPLTTADVDPIVEGELTTQLAASASAERLAHFSDGNHDLSAGMVEMRITEAGEVIGREAVRDVDGWMQERSAAHFEEAFAGVDLSLYFSPNSVKQLLRLGEDATLLSAHSELGAGARLEVVETLTLPAGAGLLTPSEGNDLNHHALPFSHESGGAIAFGQPGEDPWFVIPAPFAVDAAGARVDGTARIEARADGTASYVATLPMAWFNDEARVFPIEIDPPIALGAPVNFFASMHLDRYFPRGPGAAETAVAMFTVQDHARASADLSVGGRITWDDGTFTNFGGGPGGKRIFHDYASPDACGPDHICNVNFAICDATGRCSRERLTFILPLGGEIRGSAPHCRYSCYPDPTEERHRSFWYRAPTCAHCEVDMQANCNNPPPIEVSCGGGGLIDGDEGGPPLTPNCEPRPCPKTGGDSCLEDKFEVIHGATELAPTFSAPSEIVSVTNFGNVCYTVAPTADPDTNTLGWLSPAGGDFGGIVGPRVGGILSFFAGGADESVATTQLVTTPGDSYRVHFFLRRVEFQGPHPNRHTVTVEAYDGATLLGSSGPVTSPTRPHPNFGRFNFVATSELTTVVLRGTNCEDTPGAAADCNTNQDLGINFLAISRNP